MINILCFNFKDAAERMQLISLSDMENGLEERREHRVPPVWVDQLEEAQFTLTKLKKKIEDLKKLQDRHLHRPTFDESSDEEVLIENCTSDITILFNTVHRLLQFIKSHSIEGEAWTLTYIVAYNLYDFRHSEGEKFNHECNKILSSCFTGPIK